MAPEGTRSHTDHLKSGFYQLALAANLPIGLGYIDYGRRHVGIDVYVRMTGDEERDLAMLRRFYADKQPRIPANAGGLRFRRGRRIDRGRYGREHYECAPGSRPAKNPPLPGSGVKGGGEPQRKRGRRRR